MDKLKDAKYFTKLDVRWGYNNVRIQKRDKWKAAFKTNKGLFEPTVMFFGMCNSPATFQASVAMAIADVFSKNGYTVPNKIAKILRIFDGLETLKSRWVISLH